ncbi:MAG: transposase [candidate division WS1 bacterium]|nr:transposase [candidate division WS1 bacterium]
MPRAARVIVAGHPHHVTQRGNRRQQVFFSPDDYQQYLITLGNEAQARALKIWAYCLMPNHVDLIVVPQGSEALAHTLRTVHSTHARHINQQHDWEGHLWQGRYFSCLLDEIHLGEALRYVERNPVRAGMVERASDYAWSSAAPHCGLRPDPVLASDLPLLDLVPDWRAWLEPRDDEQVVQRVRFFTARGWPMR